MHLRSDTNTTDHRLRRRPKTDLIPLSLSFLIWRMRTFVTFFPPYTVYCQENSTVQTCSPKQVNKLQPQMKRLWFLQK